MYKKIEALMQERGVTPHLVALRTGIAPSSFSEWKSGQYKPSIDSISKLAKYFDVPFMYFVEDSDNDTAD